MATIKSHTSLEQSKKLAEILPLESADMYWDLLSKDKYAKVNNIGNCLGRTCVYAWSLAALLGLLPKRIEIADNVYELSVYLYGLYYWNVNNGNLLLEVKGEDNLVDACVAIFEKLDELNLL